MFRKALDLSPSTAEPLKPAAKSWQHMEVKRTMLQRPAEAVFSRALPHTGAPQISVSTCARVQS